MEEQVLHMLEWLRRKLDLENRQEMASRLECLESKLRLELHTQEEVWVRRGLHGRIQFQMARPLHVL